MTNTPPPRKPAAAKAQIKKNADTLKPPVKRKPQVRKKVAPKRSYKGLKIGIAVFLLVLASPFYYRYVVTGFTNAWHWLNDIGEDTNYRHYKSFNIHVSEKYTIHGIDVSYAQGKIDWPQG